MFTFNRISLFAAALVFTASSASVALPASKPVAHVDIVSVNDRARTLDTDGADPGNGGQVPAELAEGPGLGGGYA